MIIRKATSSDVSKLFALEQEIFTQENFPLSKASLVYHVKNNLVYVAEVDGNIAGYVLALVKRKNAKVYSLGVSQDYRGKKIARRLLLEVITQLFDMDFKQIFLEVRRDNVNAVTLYKSVGFRIQKIAKAFYRDGCDAYIMVF